jgi:hypothetical protein
MDLSMILAIIGAIGTAASLADLGYKYGPTLLRKFRERGLGGVRESVQIEAPVSNLNEFARCPRQFHYVPRTCLKKSGITVR